MVVLGVNKERIFLKRLDTPAEIRTAIPNQKSFRIRRRSRVLRCDGEYYRALLFTSTRQFCRFRLNVTGFNLKRALANRAQAEPSS